MTNEDQKARVEKMIKVAERLGNGGYHADLAEMASRDKESDKNITVNVVMSLKEVVLLTFACGHLLSSLTVNQLMGGPGELAADVFNNLKSILDRHPTKKVEAAPGGMAAESINESTHQEGFVGPVSMS